MFRVLEDIVKNINENLRFKEWDLSYTKNAVIAKNDIDKAIGILTKRKEARKKGKQLTLPSIEERENYQSAYIKDLYTLLFSLPSISSVTMWNLTDRNAWRGHAGGVLDQELQPKKAFYTLKNLIKQTWTTKIEKEIDLNKEFHFTGFYGMYEGTIKVGNNIYKFSFDHEKENNNVIKIIL